MSAYGAPSGRSGSRSTTIVLTLAILAVLGGVFGYFTGSQARADDRSDARQQDPAPDVTTTSAKAEPGPTGSPCPGFVSQAAKARAASLPLIEKLYIATEKSEVWICQAADGALWYQGHGITNGHYYPDETPEEGRNGLLLKQVKSTGKDSYEAINKDENGETHYLVTTQTLIKDNTKGNKTTENVLRKRS
jgi:hypothetical protein